MQRLRWAGLVAATIAAISISPPALADDTGDGFRIRVARSTEMTVGSQRGISLTILPKSSFSISRSGPVEVRLLLPKDGLEAARTRYRRDDAVDPGAEAPRFEMRLRGARAGEYRVQVSVHFWLCRKRTCRPVHRTLPLTVTVRPPPADAGPPSDASS